MHHQIAQTVLLVVLVVMLAYVMLRQEMIHMEETATDATLQDQEATTTKDVQALSDAFTGFEAAVAAEIATIKTSPAAADPVIAQGLTNIEALTAKIVADTAAANPPAPATGTGSTGTGTGDAPAA